MVKTVWGSQKIAWKFACLVSMYTFWTILLQNFWQKSWLSVYELFKLSTKVLKFWTQIMLRLHHSRRNISPSFSTSFRSRLIYTSTAMTNTVSLGLKNVSRDMVFCAISPSYAIIHEYLACFAVIEADFVIHHWNNIVFSFFNPSNYKTLFVSIILY